MSAKKQFLLIGVAFAVFLACVVALLPRTPNFDDSDFKLIRSEIADHQNAFFYLEQAATNLYWPERDEKEIGKIANEADWDTALESELLSENRTTLALLGKALECPELQVPALKDFAEEYPYLKDWKNISLVASIEAASLFRQGKQKEAFDLAQEIVHLGHMIEDSHGPIIHYLVGSAVKSVGLERLRKMTTKADLPPAQLTFYIQKLEAYKANQSGLTNAFKAEYEVSVKGFEDLMAGKSLGTNSTVPPFATSVGIKPVFSLTKTKMLLIRPGRIFLKCIPQPFIEMPLHELPQPPTNNSVVRMVLKGNAVGEMLVGMLQPSWERVLPRKCQENATVSATQLFLGLRAYHSEHGSLPASLAELVPRFVSSVPLDDFDGKPFRYSREKKLIWSVGKDLKDSGGQEFDQKKQRLDLPFRIEF